MTGTDCAEVERQEAEDRRARWAVRAVLAVLLAVCALVTLPAFAQVAPVSPWTVWRVEGAAADGTFPGGWVSLGAPGHWGAPIAFASWGNVCSLDYYTYFGGTDPGGTGRYCYLSTGGTAPSVNPDGSTGVDGDASSGGGSRDPVAFTDSESLNLIAWGLCFVVLALGYIGGRQP